MGKNILNPILAAAAAATVAAAAAVATPIPSTPPKPAAIPTKPISTTKVADVKVKKNYFRVNRKCPYLCAIRDIKQRIFFFTKN